jgi:hypothetical protein
VDQTWTHGIILELTSELPDVDAQILLRITFVLAPHGIEELSMRERLATMRDERAQEPPLRRRQVDLRLATPNDAARQVDFQIADLQAAARFSCLTARPTP